MECETMEFLFESAGTYHEKFYWHLSQKHKITFLEFLQPFIFFLSIYSLDRYLCEERESHKNNFHGSFMKGSRLMWFEWMNEYEKRNLKFNVKTICDLWDFIYVAQSICMWVDSKRCLLKCPHIYLSTSVFFCKKKKMFSHSMN